MEISKTVNNVNKCVHTVAAGRQGRLIERSQNAPAVEANTKRIHLEKEKYLLRQEIVEHPFGTIKRQWGFDYMLLKGLRKIEADMGLILTVYNLRRLITIVVIDELKKRLQKVLRAIFRLISPVIGNGRKYFTLHYSAPA